VTAAGLSIPVGAARTSALRRFLEDECFVILMAAAWFAAVVRLLPALVVQDTWLAFVDGREVAAHGPPHVDTHVLWSHGFQWTDQQWLAHLVLYGLAHAGGVRLALAVAFAVAVAATVGSAVVARRLGGSAVTTALVLPLPVLVAPWLLQVRTQTLALPLFVAVYGLLAHDARRPTPRVLLALPALALWGNLHGTVLLGVVLACAHALMRCARRRRADITAVALLAGAPLALLASPYGFELIGYYRLMLLDSHLGAYVQEWQPAQVGPATLAFFAVLFGIVWLLARHGARVTPFERMALPLLGLAGMLATRNAVWFAVAAGIALPRLVDAVWRGASAPVPAPMRRVNLALAVVALAAALASALATATEGPNWFERSWPEPAAAAVARAAGPTGLVLADDEHADWLLWKEPRLLGRVAYDVRFELLPARKLDALRAFRARTGPGWKRCAGGFGVLTFGRGPGEAKQAHAFLSEPGSRVAYRARGFVAVERRPGRGDGSCQAAP
jgi:hypothetical protein